MTGLTVLHGITTESDPRDGTSPPPHPFSGG